MDFVKRITSNSSQDGQKEWKKLMKLLSLKNFQLSNETLSSMIQDSQINLQNIKKNIRSMTRMFLEESELSKVKSYLSQLKTQIDQFLPSSPQNLVYLKKQMNPLVYWVFNIFKTYNSAIILRIQRFRQNLSSPTEQIDIKMKKKKSQNICLKQKNPFSLEKIIIEFGILVQEYLKSIGDQHIKKSRIQYSLIEDEHITMRRSNKDENCLKKKIIQINQELTSGCSLNQRLYFDSIELGLIEETIQNLNKMKEKKRKDNISFIESINSEQDENSDVKSQKSTQSIVILTKEDYMQKSDRLTTQVQEKQIQIKNLRKELQLQRQEIKKIMEKKCDQIDMNKRAQEKRANVQNINFLKKQIHNPEYSRQPTMKEEAEEYDKNIPSLEDLPKLIQKMYINDSKLYRKKYEQLKIEKNGLEIQTQNEIKRLKNINQKLKIKIGEKEKQCDDQKQRSTKIIKQIQQLLQQQKKQIKRLVAKLSTMQARIIDQQKNLEVALKQIKYLSFKHQTEMKNLVDYYQDQKKKDEQYYQSKIKTENQRYQSILKDVNKERQHQKKKYQKEKENMTYKVTKLQDQLLLTKRQKQYQKQEIQRLYLKLQDHGNTLTLVMNNLGLMSDSCYEQSERYKTTFMKDSKQAIKVDINKPDKDTNSST